MPIPHKPPYLTDAEWNFILARDNHRCSIYNQCTRRTSSQCCSEELDHDHAQPEELGGDSSFANIRLLCAGYNRGRGLEPLQKWAEPNYWDNKLQVGKLRNIQQIAGVQALDDLVRDVKVDPRVLRRVLLGATTLLPGATGIGKTILVQSVLFKFNSLIGLGYPRAKNVLWLATDTTLRDMARVEIENEAYDLRVVSRKPIVHTAESFVDLLRGPQGAAVVVSTAQALWKVEKEGGLRRSDDEIRTALLHFDTMVFDEGDWAAGEVRHIAQIARHALQIAPTASPLIDPIADEEVSKDFLKRFVLISTEAVADYKRAVALDACLKTLVTPIIGAGHKGRDELSGGHFQTKEQKVTNDHALYRSLILEAIIEADHFETRMRHIEPEEYYSPHVMVRMEDTGEIKAMYPDLRSHIHRLYDEGKIINAGWDVSMIFRGHTRLREYVERDEADLAAIDRHGYFRHPFMRAKNRDGQADKGCKRVLLMCNIGVRGLNNWPVQTIVDCTSRVSIRDIIHFAYGRAIRWPKERNHWHDAGSPLSEFVKMHISIAPRDNADAKEKAILGAKEFIENMQQKIADTGFMTWQDLIEGRSLQDADIEIDPSNRTLNEAEKFALQNMLAQTWSASGDIKPEDVNAAIQQAFPDCTGRLRDRMVKYATRLTADVNFRDQELNATDLFRQYQAVPESVVDKLLPQEEYDVETLKRWVKSDPTYKTIWPQCIEELDQGRVVTKELVSNVLRAVQESNYRSPARIYRLHGNEKGALTEVANELATQLYQANQAPQDKSLVPRKVITAANILFGVDNAEEGGPMDHPAYHIAIIGKHRRRLQAMAHAMLIKDGLLGASIQQWAGSNEQRTDNI